MAFYALRIHGDLKEPGMIERLSLRTLTNNIASVALNVAHCFLKASICSCISVAVTPMCFSDNNREVVGGKLAFFTELNHLA